MEARLLACAACHGPRGPQTPNHSPPRGAARPVAVTTHMCAPEDAPRRSPPMNYLLEYIPDPYLQKMADYFAALRPPPVARPASDVSPAVLARGGSLVTEGDQAHG